MQELKVEISSTESSKEEEEEVLNVENVEWEEEDKEEMDSVRWEESEENQDNVFRVSKIGSEEKEILVTGGARLWIIWDFTKWPA